MQRLAAYGVLALIIATLASVWAIGATSHHLNEQSWQQLLDNDRAAVDSDMVSARAAHTNGDDPARFLSYCRTAVDAYNADAAAAGLYLPAGYPGYLTATTECKATP